MWNPPRIFKKKDEAEKRAEKFNLSLSRMGRVVFRGIGGKDHNALHPQAIFKKGFPWNYSGHVGDVQIYPQMGTVTGAQSTSKRPETAMYYAAMQKGNNTDRSGWIYAIYCDKGIDYASSYINNPLITRHGAIKGKSKANHYYSGGGKLRIDMVNKGEGNQEIIMLNVEAKQVICARAVQYKSGYVYLDGYVFTNSDCLLAKTDRQLYLAAHKLLDGGYGIDEKFRFTDFHPDRYKIG